ncbi:hypothetical protein Tco_0261686 [Tanacetum coccineum]
MENANPPPNNRHVLRVVLRTRAVQELHKLQIILAFDNDSDDGKVLNEMIEYENVGMLRHERAINSFDEDDLAF